MSRTRKILINTLRVILILLMLYLGYAGSHNFMYNHVYTTTQKINYIRNYYMYTGFPRTNEKLLKSKIFKNNSVEYSPAKLLDPDAMAKHFDVACSGGGLIMIDYNHYYKDNNIYDYDSGNKVEDKKTTQLLNKELKEFTDKFGKNMGLQIYNPF
ncbi:hypothetical protein ACWCL1_07400 [Ligilactobacillus sp. LYQ135]